MSAPAGDAAPRPAGEADLDAVAGALAAAFDDDPVFNWFVRQDERRAEAIALLLRRGAARALREGGECWLAADGAGAAVWRLPGAARGPAARDARFEERICGAPDRVRRFGRFRALMAAHHPAAPPHCTLATIGVLPERQRGGVGSALMRAVLERCDRERTPAYLASTRERNLALYARHGFAVRGRFGLPDGGPPIWPMWREPRGVRGQS